MQGLRESSSGDRDPRIHSIFSQLALLRARLNRQLLLNVTLACAATVIGSAGLFMLAAIYLPVRAFAIAALVLTLGALGGVAWGVVSGVRRWTTIIRAARLADRRAELKGRLATLVAMAPQAARLPLWSFLVEDVLELRERFVPSKIAPWTIPRSLLALLLACLLAALAELALKHKRAQVLADLAVQKPPTLAQIAPALPNMPGNSTSENKQFAGSESLDQESITVEPGEGASVAVPENGKSLWSRLGARADQFAQSLQNGLTGHLQQHAFRDSDELAKADPDRQDLGQGRDGQTATDESSGNSSSDTQANSPSQEETSSGGHQSSGQLQASGKSDTQQKNQYGESAKGSNFKSAKTLEDEGERTGQMSSRENEMTYGQVGRTQSGPHGKSSRPGAGASHGFGSDPEHLYSKTAEVPKTASHTFKITLQGSMSGGPVAGSGKPYRPPRADIPLNSKQAPDEPIYRAEIPADERELIKRAFEP